MSKTVKEAYAKIQESLFESLENAGKWECPWLKSLFAYHNPLSNGGKGHEFTGFVNCAILAITSHIRGWEDPRFVTAAQVRKTLPKKGSGEDPAWWITKDEFNKGTTLFFPRIKETKNEKGEKVKEFTGWGYYRVYSAEQCDKAPKLPSLEGREFDPIAACEEAVAAMPKLPKIVHKGGRACYTPSLDQVTMPPREAFNGNAEYYSTLFHELAHATGHKSRLDRKEAFGNWKGNDKYAREELVAETAAAILCAVHGIEGRTIDNSRAYVATWRERCEEDPKLFNMAMREGLAAAEWIMGRLKKAPIKSEELN
jgi:antirestriction protein ArdC